MHVDYNNQLTIGRKVRMANVTYTSQYEGRFCKFGMLQLSYYIHKQTNGRSDWIANIMYPSHYNKCYWRWNMDQMYVDYNNQLTIGR